MCLLRDRTPNRLSHSDVSFTWRHSNRLSHPDVSCTWHHSQSAVTFWCVFYVTWLDSQSAVTFWCLFYVTLFPIGCHILMCLLRDMIPNRLSYSVVSFTWRHSHRLSHSDVSCTGRYSQSAITFWCVFYVTWLPIGCHILMCLLRDVTHNRLPHSDMSFMWRDFQSAITFWYVLYVTWFPVGCRIHAPREIICSNCDLSIFCRNWCNSRNNFIKTGLFTHPPSWVDKTVPSCLSEQELIEFVSFCGTWVGLTLSVEVPDDLCDETVTCMTMPSVLIPWHTAPHTNHDALV